jgi:hypothetical protein
MQTRKFLKALLVLIIGLTTLVLLPTQQAQASSVNYCADPSGQECNFSSRYTRLEPRKRQRDQLYAGYLNSRNRMSKSRPGAGATANPAVARRMAATAALSWALLCGGLLALAGSLRACLTQGRRKQRRHTPLGWTWASPALASVFGFVLVLTGALGTTLTSPGKSVLASAAVQSGSTGTFTAAQEIGGAGITQIGGIVYDSAGNYYVTGGFTGSLSFATNPVTTLTSTQDYDVFIAKYNASNQCLWARQANGASAVPTGLSLDGAATVALDQAGNCYVGGSFVKTLAFKAANGSTVATLTAAGSNLNFEPFVAKYDASGTLQWAQGGQSGSPQHAVDLKVGFNSIVKIVVDGTGNPYVAGSFSGASFLGQAISAQGEADALLAKLNPATGAPVWVSLPGGSANDSATALAIDANSNLYLAGATMGIATFPTQPNPTQVGDANTLQDGFVAKYSSGGACLWVSRIKGQPLALVQDLVVNAAGETFLTGAFIEQAQFVGSSYTVSSASTLPNGYVAKLATDGVAIYAQGFGEGFFASGRRILLDGAGNIYVGGNFQSGAHFGSEQVEGQDLATPNGTDQFIARYKPELDATFRFQSAKAILGTGEESANLITGTDVTATTNPMQMFYDPATNKIKLAGDTNGTVDFDGIPVDANLMGSEPNGKPADAPAHGPFSFESITPRATTETRRAFIATMTLPNRAPVASCQNVTVTAGVNGTADASINNGSADPDNDGLTLAQSPAGPYPLGTTNVTLTVTDSKGATSMCNATVTVVCPALALSKADASFAANGGAGSFTVTTATGCSWSASTSSSFIHLTAPRPTASGTQTISYTLDSNNSATRRSGTIEVSGQTFTIWQGPQFSDVALNHPFYDFIGKLAARGITGGCSTGNYCPDASTTREQIAIFIERALGAFTPPAALLGHRGSIARWRAQHANRRRSFCCARWACSRRQQDQLRRASMMCPRRIPRIASLKNWRGAGSRKAAAAATSVREAR